MQNIKTSRLNLIRFSSTQKNEDAKLIKEQQNKINAKRYLNGQLPLSVTDMPVIVPVRDNTFSKILTIIKHSLKHPLRATIILTKSLENPKKP